MATKTGGSIQVSSRLATRAIASIFLLLLTAPAAVGLTFPQAKKDGSPDRRRGAGSRGETCIAGRDAEAQGRSLFALVPEANVSLTTSERPSFFWYQPPTTRGQGLFVLREAGGSQALVYFSTFRLNGQEGIAQFSLPAGIGGVALELNKAYEWSVSLHCDPDNDSRGSQRIQGEIRRIPLSPELDSQLKVASRLKQAEIYAQNGIWNESLSALVSLRCHSATRDGSLANWAELLKSVDLEYFAQIPLLEDCDCTEQ